MMQSNSMVGKRKYQSYDPKLNVLAQLCTERIDDLLSDLDVDASLSGNKYIGVCPIHGDSDNPGTLNIYYDGYSVPGYWKCRSRLCEGKFGRNIIGFTRGRLSNLHLGYHWKKKPNAVFDFPKTLEYLCKFIGTNLNSIKVDSKEQERRRFMIECMETTNLYKYQESTIHRSKVKSSLTIPAKYFMDRGYPHNILQNFDIGMAKNPKPDTKNRVIVPLYNEKEYLCGYTCRSIFEKCASCRLFHAPDDGCPQTDFERNHASKWRHIGFEAQDQLYNYWNAKQYIKDTNTAILVEGPGDVWRLEQHGIKNAVGMFGHTLYDGQERLLANAQCMAMIVLTDSDAAGIEGASEIKKKYGRLYRLYFPRIKEHDAGDMNEDAVTDTIKPLIESAMRYV